MMTTVHVTGQTFTIDEAVLLNFLVANGIQNDKVQVMKEIQDNTEDSGKFILNG